MLIVLDVSSIHLASVQSLNKRLDSLTKNLAQEAATQ
jgi:hypothetical protein